MYPKKIFLVFFLSIIFYNCVEDLKTSFLITSITTENNKLVDVTIPKAIGDESVSMEINSEIEKIVASALQIGDPEITSSKSIEESITIFNEEFTKFNSEFPEFSQPWEAQIDGEVIHQSTEIISISITSYTNTGGAHGALHISFLNFNAVTGKRIKNDKLFKDFNAFKTIAKSYFDATIKDKNTLFEPDNFQLPQNIGYNEDGVVFLYNTYEIAPYSTGIIEFTIPIDKVSTFLAFDGSN
jgi:hypothetical protein